jgi:hypothetical protein
MAVVMRAVTVTNPAPKVMALSAAVRIAMTVRVAQSHAMHVSRANRVKPARHVRVVATAPAVTARRNAHRVTSRFRRAPTSRPLRHSSLSRISSHSVAMVQPKRAKAVKAAVVAVVVAVVEVVTVRSAPGNLTMRTPMPTRHRVKWLPQRCL